jgi:hypothetical protein
MKTFGARRSSGFSWLILPAAAFIAATARRPPLA